VPVAEVETLNVAVNGKLPDWGFTVQTPGKDGEQSSPKATESFAPLDNVALKVSSV